MNGGLRRTLLNLSSALLSSVHWAESVDRADHASSALEIGSNADVPTKADTENFRRRALSAFPVWQP